MSTRTLSTSDALAASRRYVEDRGTFPLDAFPDVPATVVREKYEELQEGGLIDRYLRLTPLGQSQ